MPGVRTVAITLTFCWLSTHVPAQHVQPTPQIKTDNLPSVCPSSQGSYSLPDLSDPTSYFICCDQNNAVRKTCRYFTGSPGTYQPLLTAPYDAASGECLNRELKSTPTNATDLANYKFAPAVQSSDAKATCQSVARLQQAGRGPVARAAVTRQAAVAAVAPAAGGEWSIIRNSAGTSSTGVVAINAVLLPQSSKVVIWSRVHMDGSNNYEPGVVSSDGVPEVSSVYDTDTGNYVVKRLRLTPFCTGNSHMPDGKVLATGGDDYSGQTGYTNGLKGIRLFEKASGNDNWDAGNWKIYTQQLQQPRWYPSQTLMPDGNRVVIMGGTRSQTTPIPVPSAEIFSYSASSSIKIDTLAVLQGFGGYILYPTVFVLPYTSSVTPGAVHMFVFNCVGGAIMSLFTDNTWREYRALSNAIWPTPGYCASYSMAGTSVLLRLEPESDYAAEVVMFGGFKRAISQCECDQETNGYAHRIKLDKKTVDDNRLSWKRELMPSPRNLNDGVLLPNGKVLVLNGAKRGVIANLRDAALDAWLYDPKAAAGSRFTVLAAASLKRYYHSIALLLPDASILVAGSEYGECTEACAHGTPWLFQHQAERFKPPYFFSGSRPSIISTSTATPKYNTDVTVGYSGTVTGAVLVAPAAVTHQVNMNQRAVKLVVVNNDTTNKRITVKMPPNSYIMQPGYQMLFLMNGDVPCMKASWIKLVL